jgi:hypothetical protein
MAKERRVCPWACAGGLGEIDVVRSERAQVPGVAATTALMRCGQCQRISAAGMMTVSGDHDGPRDVECRTPLGRFEGVAWVPASIYVVPLVLHPKHTRGRGRRC